MKSVPRENNPYWPLPPDYDDLSDEGKRCARVNACRQWMLPSNSLDRVAKGDAFIGSLLFFDHYYLHSDESTEHYPGFYDMDPLPTPRMHRDILRLWGTERRTLIVCPRGSAKSKLCKKAMILRLVTHPLYSIMYATSSHDNAAMAGQEVKMQCYENRRIFDDFGPEYGGRLKPHRGDAAQGAEFFSLTNGSWLRCLSADSRQRGNRPRRYVLDDPETDSKEATSMEVVRTYMEQLLFKVVLPMTFRPDCGVDWIATFVSRRHYAWHAMQTEGEDKKALDPRFDRWARYIIRACEEGPDGKLISCWPEMWPATRAERLELGKTDPHYLKIESLEEIKDSMSTPNFLSEYMARPGEGTSAYFGILSHEKHHWWLEQADAESQTDPMSSEAYICWRRGNDIHREKLRDFLREARPFLTADTSYTAKKDSDFKVACVMGITSKNELFVLDLWMGQTIQTTLVREILRLVDKWKCRSIHPEIVRESYSLLVELESVIRTRATEVMGGHIPAIKALKPPSTLRKEDKIAGLLWRFEHGLIKFPLQYRDRNPWRSLFNQIEEFNPDAADGGLQHDDALDAVAMSSMVIRGRPGARIVEEEPEDLDPIKEILAGRSISKDGQHHGLSVDWSRVNPNDLNKVMQFHQDQARDDTSTESKV